jgi:hypothetical protein
MMSTATPWQLVPAAPPTDFENRLKSMNNGAVTMDVLCGADLPCGWY